MSTPTGPTRIDPIIQAVVRKAETIYSKMGIRREESEDLTRKKKGGGDNDAQALPWEDTTEVSIAALRGFLEDLLGIGHFSPQESEVTSIPPPLPAPIEHAVNPTAARAVNAYQSMGRVVHDRNVESSPFLQPSYTIPSDVAAEDSKESPEKTVLGDDFTDDDRARLGGYLKDMVYLESRGVTTLTLRRSLTFLESIHQAIEDAK